MVLNTRKFEPMQKVPVARKNRADHRVWVCVSQEIRRSAPKPGKGSRIKAFGKIEESEMRFRNNVPRRAG
jgi:hypothetical protein